MRKKIRSMSDLRIPYKLRHEKTGVLSFGDQDAIFESLLLLNADAKRDI